MTAPALLVDTNILWKRGLRQQLTTKIETGKLRVYVPTLIHAERIRQIADIKGERFALDFIQQAVKQSRFQLLPFDVKAAEAMAEVWLNLKKIGFGTTEWKQHRLDILLCAIASTDNYILITEDKGKHFQIISKKMDTIELQTWLQTL